MSVHCFRRRRRRRLWFCWIPASERGGGGLREADNAGTMDKIWLSSGSK